MTDVVLLSLFLPPIVVVMMVSVTYFANSQQFVLRYRVQPKQNKTFALEQSSVPWGLDGNTNRAAVLLLGNTNMAFVTSRENTLYLHQSIPSFHVWVQVRTCLMAAFILITC